MTSRRGCRCRWAGWVASMAPACCQRWTRIVVQAGLVGGVVGGVELGGVHSRSSSSVSLVMMRQMWSSVMCQEMPPALTRSRPSMTVEASVRSRSFHDVDGAVDECGGGGDAVVAFGDADVGEQGHGEFGLLLRWVWSVARRPDAAQRALWARLAGSAGLRGLRVVPAAVSVSLTGATGGSARRRGVEVGVGGFFGEHDDAAGDVGGHLPDQLGARRGRGAFGVGIWRRRGCRRCRLCGRRPSSRRR